MSAEMQIKFVGAMRRTEALLPAQGFSKWSLFAGTGISTRVTQALASVLLNKYNMVFSFHDSLYCEIAPAKQKFILQQHDPKVLVQDVNLLDADSAPNVINKQSQLLPFCFALDAGIPCTSRTPLSSKSSANMNCVQDEREATGLGFSATKKCIQRHWPTIVSMECVTQLGAKGLDKPSDADWMCDSLREIGYWSDRRILQARDYGSYAPRERLYWAALLGIEGKQDEVSHFFNNMLTSMKTKPEDNETLRFNSFTLDKELRSREAEKLRLRTHASFGMRKNKVCQHEVQWKADHKLLCDANGIPWPPAMEKAQQVIEVGGLLPREVDAAYLLHSIFAYVGLGNIAGVEYIDINPTLTRIVRGYVDVDTQKPHNVDRSPWRDRPPTLTGSLALLLRYKDPGSGKVVVRAAEAWEYMRLQGWEDNCWKVDAMPAGDTVKEEDLELIANMAGNAYSVYHYGPWLCALLATWGQFAKEGTGVADQDAAIKGPPEVGLQRGRSCSQDSAESQAMGAAFTR